VHGGPYQELKFIIYNEWGEAIFESNNQDMGWDGTFKGVPQPIGVYVYTVIATSLDGKSHHFWGDVTLLR
jgi:gliding motility-associated-like protein